MAREKDNAEGKSLPLDFLYGLFVFYAAFWAHSETSAIMS